MISFAQAKDIDLKKCTDCHELDAKAFAASVHGGLPCIDCHTQGPFGEHEGVPAKVDCVSCHEDATKEFSESIHGKARASGITDAPDCAGCHEHPHAILSSSEDRSPHARKNIPVLCARCHADPKITKKYDIPLPDPLVAHRNSVHGKALAAGNLDAAVCSDCHGAHTIQPGREMSSQTAKAHIPETCGKCHSDILKEFTASVHGQAVAKQIPEAPVCTTCHGEHGISAAQSAGSPVSTEGMITRTCGNCHGDLSLTEKYGLSPVRLSTYLASYHGMAARRGAVTVANCASCHGTHNILPSADPKSSIHVTNLPRTCGQCHPGTSADFAKVPVHLQTSPTGSPVLYWARQIYLTLIALTIGLMLLHNLFIYGAAVAAKIRRQRGETTYERFTPLQLISHGLLMISFSTLVVTGFALHFHGMAWTRPLDWLHITEEGRRIIHRTAACVMLLSGFLHIGYILFSRHGRYDWKAFWPRLTDLSEMVSYLRHYWAIFRGRSNGAPRLGRYSYMHKAEYWALIWGTVIMAVTGFALWFPEVSSRFLPIWGLPLMELVHYYEAWLATLAIFVWHFFFVIFHPDEYPMSTLWMTGRITHEEMERDHPRELEELTRETTESDP